VEVKGKDILVKDRKTYGGKRGMALLILTLGLV
jgi:hypothetical protein